MKTDLVIDLYMIASPLGNYMSEDLEGISLLAENHAAELKRRGIEEGVVLSKILSIFSECDRCEI